MCEITSFNAKIVIFVHQPLAFDRVFDDFDGLMINGCITQAFKIDLATCRIIAMNRLWDFVEIQSHEYRAQPQTMISMKMANEYARDTCRSYIGKDELALCSLSGIKKKTLFVPTDEISPVVALTRRLLT